MLLALVTGVDELSMSDDEAEQIAVPADRVMRAYQVPRNEKVESLVALAGAVGIVYGSKIIAFNTRKKLEERARRQQEAKGTTAKEPDAHRQQRERAHAASNAIPTVERGAFATDNTPGKVN